MAGMAKARVTKEVQEVLKDKQVTGTFATTHTQTHAQTHTHAQTRTHTPSLSYTLQGCSLFYSFLIIIIAQDSQQSECTPQAVFLSMGYHVRSCVWLAWCPPTP